MCDKCKVCHDLISFILFLVLVVMDLCAGKLIKNTYKLEKLIGEGSSGQVWIASSSNGQVVIKVIPLAGWRKNEYEREVMFFDTFKHKNIVTMYDQFTLKKYGFIVMERLDQDLLEFIGDFCLTEAEARLIFRQILLALHLLHENKCAHLDIKPENILISGSDTVKLADFGSIHQWSDSSLRTGKCGTSFYCSPEIKNGRVYYADKADIWSLGITLHVMLTGFWPFVGKNEKEVLSNAKKGKVDISKDNLSNDLTNLLTQMLNLDPEKRPSAKTLLDHPWLIEHDESSIIFTPRSYKATDDDDESGIFSSTSVNSLSDSEDIGSFSIVLPESIIDGFKSPRQCQISAEESIVRASPRPNINNKQSKGGWRKFISNFKKKLPMGNPSIPSSI